MQNKPAHQPSLKDIDFSYYIRHYWDLFWRCRWFIVIAGPLVTGAWVFYLLNFGRVAPEMGATAVIGIENTTTMSAVRDVGSAGENYADQISSRLFLREVAEELSLRFRLAKLQRDEVFDSIHIDTTAALGRYTFKISKDRDPTYAIHFSNVQAGFRDKLIKQGRVVVLDTVNLPGMHLDFSSAFLRSPREITFFVTTERVALDDLLRRMTVGRVGHRATQMPLTVKGRDYGLITSTANTIADLFVARNLSFRKRRTTEVLRILQRQLETAETELSRSEEHLRAFRSANPTIGLGQAAQGALSDLTQVEASAATVQSKQEEANRLNATFTQASPAERQFLASEVALFLHNAGVPTAALHQSQLQSLLTEHAHLAQTHAAGHPAREENKKRLEQTVQAIHATLQGFIAQAGTRIEQAQTSAANLTNRLHTLPAKEMRLLELQRKYTIDLNIHSAILNRYNEARIADAVEVADIYVLDYAVPPVPPPDFVNVLIRMGIGVLLGLGLAFGPVIALDLIDKTARTEPELKKLIAHLTLETIPRITVERGRKTTAPKKEKKNRHKTPRAKPREIDKNLITADFAPNYINEIFRSLRTKLLYLLHDHPHKRFAVTSLNMGEGKSTLVANIAITMAQQNLRTLLVDADLRRGVLHNSFVLSKSPGLSDLIFSDKEIAAQSIGELAQVTHVPNLWLLSTGPNVPNPQELLGSKRFTVFLEAASTRFDCVILDTPPLAVATDAVVIAELVARYVVVVMAGKTNIIDLRKKIDEFPVVKTKVAGMVLNCAPVDRKIMYYKYSNYHY